MTFAIRKARVEDAEAIADILAEAGFLDDLRTIRLGCLEQAYCLAEEHGNVVVAVIMRTSTESRYRTEFKIPLLATRRAYRRRGLARSLLCKIIEEADGKGASIVAYAKNEESADLFRDAGFLLVPEQFDRDGNRKYERPSQ